MNCNSVTVKIRNKPAVIVDAVVRLVGPLEALLRDRLETTEQCLATAPGPELDEFFIARRVRRALARPPFPERRKSPKQFLRVARVRTNVVIPEHNRARRARRNLANDFVNGTIAHAPGPVDERDRAVVTTVRTTSSGDRHRFPVAASLNKIPTWRRHTRERRAPCRNIHSLELSAPCVVEDSRPRVFRLANNDGIRVALGFFGE